MKRGSEGAYCLRHRFQGNTRRFPDNAFPFPPSLILRHPSHTFHVAHRSNEATINSVIDVRPEPGISIAKHLEPAVRGLCSPTNNFIWTQSDVVCTIDATPGRVLPEGAFDNAAEVLRIGLIHNNANHDGNVVRETKKRGPQLFDDEYDSHNDAMSLEAIIYALANKLSVVVASVRVVRQRDSELVALSLKATRKETFPNMMGNKKVYPDPWMSKKAKSAKKPDLEDIHIANNHLQSTAHLRVHLTSSRPSQAGGYFANGLIRVLPG